MRGGVAKGVVLEATLLRPPDRAVLHFTRTRRARAPTEVHMHGPYAVEQGRSQ